MIPDQHETRSRLPPDIPPHLVSGTLPPNPPPLAELAEPGYSIEPLDESGSSILGIIVIGIGTIVWYVVALQEFFKIGGAPRSESLRFAFELLLMAGSFTFFAWIPAIMGLGMLSVWIRYAIGSIASIPPAVIMIIISRERDPGEFILRVIIWLATISAIFWIFRLFRWRITRAEKLVLTDDVGKREVVLIPLNKPIDEMPALVHWHRYLRNSPHKFLDRFRPDQFNLRQMMLVTFIIAAFLTFAKLLDQAVEIFSFRGGSVLEVFLPLLIFAFASLIVTWSILRSQKVVRYYLIWLCLIFGTTFVIVFLVTTRGIVNLEADFYQTMQIGSGIALVFSFGCLWMMVLRCIGFRFIRLAPSGFSSESLDEVKKPL